MGKWSFSDEAKVCFYLPNSENSIFARFRSNEYAKIHYDSGITLINNKMHNFYGSISTNKNFNQCCFKIGVHHLSDPCSSDNRLKILRQGSVLQTYFYSRTMITHGRWRFGLLGVFDLQQKILQKNNFMFGYKHNEKHYFFGRA